VFEEHGFDELEDDGLFFGVEVLGGFANPLKGHLFPPVCPSLNPFQR
jgi:hypothetical protein